MSDRGGGALPGLRDQRDQRGQFSQRDGIALALIFALALTVRMVFMRDWLNFDETQHYLIAESPFWSDFRREFRLRAHPPLAYLAMKPFVLAGSSALWVRAAPMLAGLAGVGIAFALLRRTLRSFWPAVLGTIVIALMPLFVQQSIVARQYSLSLVFVWSALYFAAGIAQREETRLRDHLALAAAQLAALMTEYTAVLAMVPLSLMVYLPLGLRRLREGRVLEVAGLAAIQLGVALPCLLLFRWHFQGSVPHFPHTEGDTYLAGLDAGLGPLLAYLAGRIPRFVDGLLPHPFGVVMLVLAWLPLTPVFRDHANAGLARAAALFSLLGVLMLVAVAAAGALPFGGMPRHSVSIVPGIVFAAIVSCSVALGRWTSPGALRALLAAALVALSLPGVYAGWGRLSPHRNSFYELTARARVPEYLERPAPIVCNNRGRSLLSWYFFPGTAPRRTSHVAFVDRFDYGGIPVVQTPIDAIMLKSVIQLAQTHGEVWVLYSALELDDLQATYAHLKAGVRESLYVTMQYSSLSKKFVLPSILAVVTRTSPGSDLADLAKLGDSDNAADLADLADWPRSR